MSARAVPCLDHGETRLDGVERDTPYGGVWLARAVYPAAYRHGRIDLRAGRDWHPEDLSRIAREPRAGTLRPERWVALDVESTGLGARSGTLAFLVGLGFWDGDDYIVEQMLLRDPADEPALLHAATARLGAFDGVATFNGKAFDLPLLATRYALARQPTPLERLVHCDTLHAVRRAWTDAGGCRLAAIEASWLGVRRGRDVAGRDVPDIYLDYLRGGDAAPLGDVLAHNRADILSLQLILAHLARFLGRARTAGRERRDESAGERLQAARVLASSGDEASAIALLGECIEAGSRLDVRQAARAMLARYHKRAGRVVAACTLWEAMQADDPAAFEPCEELAKAYEHHLGDPGGALVRVSARLAGPPLDRARSESLAHRERRLTRRLGGKPHRPEPRVSGWGPLGSAGAFGGT
jgi:uncharacterized protein YprB with RNaseH-like and TPR domain